MTATYECKEGAKPMDSSSERIANCTLFDKTKPYTWSYVDLICERGKHDITVDKLHLHMINYIHLLPAL